jgi:predicted RNA binding protein YcfA (HicA-like mRNA interferase family)
MGRYRKDVNEMISYAEGKGFKVVGMTGTGHWKLTHPRGGILIISATPSGGRWRENSRSTINKLLRDHKND